MERGKTGYYCTLYIMSHTSNFSFFFAEVIERKISDKKVIAVVEKKNLSYCSTKKKLKLKILGLDAAHLLM